jgi:hypothetical protein
MNTNRKTFLKTTDFFTALTVVLRHVLRGSGYIVPGNRLTKGVVDGTGIAKKTRLPICLCLLLLLQSCETQKYAASDRMMIPADFAGMVHAGHTRQAEEYRFLDEMGISWVLTTFYWDAIERQQGVWDFSGTDAFVDSAKVHGKKIIAVLAYQTDWLFPEGESKKYIAPENIRHFVHFVEKTVSRYKGRVDAWQIWNEPNFSLFWKGSREEYLALTNVASAKIRETDPDAQLLMGGFNLLGYRPYLKGLFESGAMQYGGDMSFHPYNLNPGWVTGCYTKLLKRLDRENFTGNVVVTEIGYPTGGWYPHSIPEKKLGPYIVKTMTLLAVHKARMVCWYQLFDPPKDRIRKSDSEDFFGLAYPDYEKKQGADAFPACVKNIAGKTYDPSYPSLAGIPRGVQAYYFEGDDGSRTLILWKKTAGSKKMPLSLTGNNALLFDSETCLTVPVNTDETLKVTRTPVIITWREDLP